MRTRGVVLAVIAAVAVVGGAVVVLVSERRADEAIARVRTRAAATTVSGDDLLGAMFSADGDLARRLGVDPAEVALSSTGPNQWCVEVTVRRMVGVRSASFTMQPGEALVPTPAC